MYKHMLGQYKVTKEFATLAFRPNQKPSFAEFHKGETFEIITVDERTNNVKIGGLVRLGKGNKKTDETFMLFFATVVDSSGQEAMVHLPMKDGKLVSVEKLD
jgi:hypothetical protein